MTDKTASPAPLGDVENVIIVIQLFIKVKTLICKSSYGSDKDVNQKDPFLDP